MTATRRYGFRAVHPDFRSRNGFRWAFPGATSRSDDNIDPNNDSPCPSHPGDGVCLAKSAAGMASGGIPAITVLVCSFDPSQVLAEDEHKVRLRGDVRVESVHDLPAILRGDPDACGHDALPTAPNLRGANLRGADLRYANLRDANLLGADANARTTWPVGFDPEAAGVTVR